MIGDEIFNSRLRLDFKEKKTKDEYAKYFQNTSSKFSTYLTVSLALFSFFISIYLSVKKYGKEDSMNEYKIHYYISLSLTAGYFVLIPFNFYFRKKKNITVLNFINYTLFCFEVYFLQFSVLGNNNIYGIDISEVYANFLFEIFIRMIIISLNLFHFFHALLMNLLIMSSLFTLAYFEIYSDIFPQIRNILVVYTSFNIFLFLFSFYVERKEKTLFYYKNKFIEIKKREKETLDNVDTGIIRIKENKIYYINQTLQHKFKELLSLKKSILKYFNDQPTSIHIGDEMSKVFDLSDYFFQNSHHVLTQLLSSHIG
jgi:hypothetical protein